jgi:hypothetical protein
VGVAAMSEDQGADESGKNAVPAPTRVTTKRRLLLKSAQIGAAMPVVMTISHRSAQAASDGNSAAMSTKQ